MHKIEQSFLLAQDHDVVKEMLRARPVNEMALKLMLTRELAASLIKHESVLNRIMTPDKHAVLEQNGEGDDQQRERVLARILMDSSGYTPEDDGLGREIATVSVGVVKMI